MEEKTPAKKYPLLFKSFLLMALIWTVVAASFLTWAIKSANDNFNAITLAQARSFFEQIVLTRYWNSIHGGVYVPVSKEIQPNPFLDVPHRDIITKDGQQLTLINPAYMTRQIAEIAAGKDKVQFHITSLKPIRPQNAPYDWEAKALSKFSAKSDEYYEWWLPAEKGKKAFRYMAPLWVEKPCLSCHAKQGYAEGDLRGGISITIPADEILSGKDFNNRVLVFGYLTIWTVGMLGISIAYRLSRREYMERSRLIEKLEAALKDVKTLKGFIPICASCKKVRDDQGYWNQIEKYIRDRSEAEFSHGICPDCAEKLYPDYNTDENAP
jgi:hypothetical protein